MSKLPPGLDARVSISPEIALVDEPVSPNEQRPGLFINQEKPQCFDDSIDPFTGGEVLKFSRNFLLKNWRTAGKKKLYVFTCIKMQYFLRKLPPPLFKIMYKLDNLF